MAADERRAEAREETPAEPRDETPDRPSRGPSDAEALLAGLNERQREAALALVGPVAILAGAGTGKTRTITHRIAYGIRTGVYDPSAVLALTFTTKAAGELRGRLRELGAPAVAARTFHSAALSQLGYFWPHTVGGPAPKILPSKGATISQAAERVRIRVDQASVRDIASEIEWRKVSELSIEQYGLAARSSRALPAGLDAQQMVDLHQAYEDLKDERRQIDFEDVLLATAGMLELEPWVTQRVREQYRFLVVDEYQDVSPLQQRLIDLWLGDRRNLCVVGDPAQTIYSFTGASSRFLTGFADRYPDARVVELTGGYRSSGPIIAAANEIARRIPHALQLEPVESTSQREPLPELLEFHDDAEEAGEIAERVKEDLEAGIRPSEIAILFRTNAQTEPFERALAQAGVPYALAGQRPFFDEPAVRQAMAAIRSQALVDDGSRPLFQLVSDILRDAGWTQRAPEGEGALRERWMAWDRLLRLAEEQPEGTTLRRFSDELQERAALRHEPALEAVTLTSVHAAKGLEWDSVLLVGCSEGLLPIGHAKDLEGIDEERRLFYVAITRARRRLRLSSTRFGGRRDGSRTPSRFLAELGTRTRRGTGPARDGGAGSARA
ncbi:ATP-dependent DNA helicase UvrD2 [Pseudoclavibacter triregionum]|nr:ATP-dependent DNA helicase UvrD2 [Pseudoclavibacter triregionum]